jgi:hypothetical protein
MESNCDEVAQHDESVFVPREARDHYVVVLILVFLVTPMTTSRRERTAAPEKLLHIIDTLIKTEAGLSLFFALSFLNTKDDIELLFIYMMHF